MILQLVDGTDSILTKTIEAFDFKKPSTDPIQLAKDLYETMMEYSALGLAAPQVGIPARAFAIRTVPGIVCFNPRIVDQSTLSIMLEEGCLSFPNWFIKIRRPKTIKVRYQEPNSTFITRVFEGLTARCFMHELDHLNGVLYQQHTNRVHIDQAMRRKKELDRSSKRVIVKEK